MENESVFGVDPEQLKKLLSVGEDEQSDSASQNEQSDSSKAQAQNDPEVTASMFMDKTGSQIGPFRIEKELGRGGAGVVYLAQDTKLDRQVAIKSLPPELANNEKFQARFQREAKLLASMNHPNIATIHEELEESHGQKYLVLEYVPGETLREKIAKDAIELKQALVIAIDIADAIAAAHANGVIHRDIKPENIKITPDGRTKLLDFGIARMMGIASITASTLTESGHIVGTIGYMSPEQARGKSADHRTDIWAIGCILYEMITGHCAFSGETGTDILASILKTDPDWQELPSDMDASVRSIIERCLEKNADERYQSAEELLAELQECRKSLMALPPKVLNARALFAKLQRPKIAVGVLLVLFMVIAGIGWGIHRSIKKNWANNVALPEIIELVRNASYFEAFQLAQEAQEYLSNNRMFQNLLPEMSRLCSISTNPPEAQIAYKEYSDLDGEWIELGDSPVDCRLPFGTYRWMITKPGYAPLEFAREISFGGATIEMEIDLYEDSEPGMVLIGGSFWMDKYEVTNEEFQEFVEAGGYQDPKYWTEKFIDESGREISFQEAMESFRDSSLRPGPATWVGGTFPIGEADYPVSGVSWYEAAAYAEFADKSLPAFQHWFIAAALQYHAQIFIPLSNFDDSGLLPVGTSGALCPSGVYDIAGNVREWCYNPVDDSGSQRYILGGAWLQLDYMYHIMTTESPWDRDQMNGFRCAKYLADTEPELIAELKAPRGPRDVVDYTDVKPIPDDELNDYIEDYYSYEPASAEELDFKIEYEEPYTESSQLWSKQKITYNTAYDDDRIIAYLFIPRGAKDPYQPVIYVPGFGAGYMVPSDELVITADIKFFINSGRAVLYPVYKGFFDRKFPEGVPWQGPQGRNDFDPNNINDLNSKRRWMVQIAMDLRRSVDYLTTRPDINIQKLTYCGVSWGACLSPIMLAVEDRIKSAVIINGGFHSYFLDATKPEANPVNFTPRVKCPVLMIGGSNDLMAPFKTSQQPMFKMLGSTDKDHKPYPGGHSNSMLLNSNAREYILNWLDDHLGPVE